MVLRFWCFAARAFHATNIQYDFFFFMFDLAAARKEITKHGAGIRGVETRARGSLTLTGALRFAHPCQREMRRLEEALAWIWRDTLGDMSHALPLPTRGSFFFLSFFFFWEWWGARWAGRACVCTVHQCKQNNNVMNEWVGPLFLGGFCHSNFKRLQWIVCTLWLIYIYTVYMK